MTGEVTFAFTDIEGSTTRWERDRIAMQDAVRRHDAVVQTAIAEHGGHVFKTAGDAFCSVFATPQDAVAAMLAAQQALNAEDFSAVDGLRVRAAIHTGSVEKRAGDYFGPAVNKVARLLAIGHGGQVLITAETAALVDGTLPADSSLRELGAYHLKDLPSRSGCTNCWRLGCRRSLRHCVRWGRYPAIFPFSIQRSFTRCPASADAMRNSRRCRRR